MLKTNRIIHRFCLRSVLYPSQWQEKKTLIECFRLREILILEEKRLENEERHNKNINVRGYIANKEYNSKDFEIEGVLWDHVIRKQTRD